VDGIGDFEDDVVDAVGGEQNAEDENKEAEGEGEQEKANENNEE